MDGGVEAIQGTVAELLTGARRGSIDASMPVDRIMMMRGFLTKVRHNAIRSEMPQTLELLHRLGLEIVFFSGFAAAFEKMRMKGGSKAERLKGFVAAVSAFADQSPSRSVLSAVARHELVCWQLSNNTVERQLRTRGRAGALSIAPGCWIERYDVDPRDPTLRSGEETAVFLVYRRFLPGSAVDVGEIAGSAAFVLAAVDGRRTAMQVARRLRRQTGVDIAAVLELLSDADRLGLVTPG
jgi:hypothetical protein